MAVTGLRTSSAGIQMMVFNGAFLYKFVYSISEPIYTTDLHNTLQHEVPYFMH